MGAGARGQRHDHDECLAVASLTSDDDKEISRFKLTGTPWLIPAQTTDDVSEYVFQT